MLRTHRWTWIGLVFVALGVVLLVDQRIRRAEELRLVEAGSYRIDFGRIEATGEEATKLIVLGHGRPIRLDGAEADALCQWLVRRSFDRLASAPKPRTLFEGIDLYPRLERPGVPNGAPGGGREAIPVP